ncbi:MAG: hypothetical protein SP1CHLAM54_01560 [Chlamydiia bacterium]|nr:hypothetical protein [Chlamydiia bacterium]MCH9615075.1 hypothetical protein [Chlamydiia bacterium]MCH9628603.1 hypothetical protein [Chlamydiia bacterium]
MKKYLVLLIMPLCLIASSVVKVETCKRYYHPDLPYLPPECELGTASGCIIEGNRILTCAHVVSGAPFLMVQKAHDHKAYPAFIEHLAEDCDLALLTVSDPDFWDGAHLLELGEMPSVGDEVFVEGFPNGGQELCRTRGIVSRTQLVEVANSGLEILMTQVDASINSGNSGGAVLADGKLIGVSTQIIPGFNNYGEIVPASIIKRFIQDVNTHGSYHGIPLVPFKWQALTNPQLASHLGAMDGGVLVLDSDDEQLKLGDVIIKIDGHLIDNQGTFLDNKGLRIDMTYLIQSHLMPSTVPIKILRDGSMQKIYLKLEEAAVPNSDFNKKRPYFILGGLVLIEDDMGVFVSAILPHPMNYSYRDLNDYDINMVNGQRVRTISDIVNALPLDSTCIIETMNGSAMIFNYQELIENHQEILDWYGITNANGL